MSNDTCLIFVGEIGRISAAPASPNPGRDLKRKNTPKMNAVQDDATEERSHMRMRKKET